METDSEAAPVDGLPVSVDAKPRQFVPKQCPACQAFTGSRNYTRVYAVKREAGMVVRYCKCGYCGNTFKQVEELTPLHCSDKLVSSDIGKAAADNEQSMDDTGKESQQGQE
jgi:hypothetical protein